MVLQGFFLEFGVGLLIAGIVDVAILSALHGLIEGDGGKGEISKALSAIHRIEGLLAESPGTPAASAVPGD